MVLNHARVLPGSTVTVTGAAGFIGRETTEALLRAGYRVRAFVRSADDAVIEGADVVVGNLENSTATREAVGDSDAVVHAAAIAHKRLGTNVDELRRINVDATRALAECAAQNKVRCFVFVSSIAAACNEAPPILREDAGGVPRGAYGQAKRDAEGALALIADRSGMRVVTLRPPLVYGPGMRGRPLTLLRLLQRGLPLPVKGMQSPRSVLSSANLSAAIITVLQQDAHGIFYVADSSPTSLEEFVEAMARALGRPAVLLRCPISVLRLIGFLGDRLRLPLNTGTIEALVDAKVVDTSRLRSVAGFSAPYSMEHSLALTAEWAKRVNSKA